MSNKVKLILVFILGVIVSVSISVYASSIINSKDVLYNNTTTNLSANVQGAIDETYTKANTLSNRITTLENNLPNKQDKSWTGISLPTPTTTSNDSVIQYTYKIDLSQYTEVIPIVYIDNYTAYTTSIYPIIGNSNFCQHFYMEAIVYGYFWEGSLCVKNSEINIATYKKSTNSSVNYFILKGLYVR